MNDAPGITIERRQTSPMVLPPTLAAIRASRSSARWIPLSERGGTWQGAYEQERLGIAKDRCDGMQETGEERDGSHRPDASSKATSRSRSCAGGI